MASGESVANDKLVVLPDRSGTDIVSPKLAGSEAIVIPESRFTELMQVLCPSCAQPDGVTVLNGDTRQLHQIRNAVIKAMARSGQGTHDDKIIDLVAQMVAWASQSSNQWRPEVISRTKSKSHIAKQVQAYIEEHFHEGVHIEDLCRTTGKEVRTLQRCLRQYFDITISDYLKMVRLSAAHRELSAAHPKEKTVAAIAMQNGFTHIGRFSVEYRKHFGESAREALATRLTR